MKRMKWVFLTAALCVALSLCLCACTGGATSEEPTAVTTRTSRTTRRVIDVTIESLITRDEIGEALSVPVAEPTVTHNGTHMYCLSADGSISVQISLDKLTRDRFDRLVGDTSEAENAPNLGQQAWWQPQKRMLLVYQGTYSLSVSVTGADYTADDALFVARQLAVPILERLPA
ncbi:MAG: hypothetical protein IKI63_04865 [Clostridia bacterium]|nr:hypothetical protein [Clostridia bacterium]